jgi:alpha-ribazole phosphatase/probable phosphoglycerate mutase
MTHTTTIDLMRHGEPVGGRRYRGQIDDPLSQRGWDQMRNAVSTEVPPWQAVVSSPLKRCSEFAQELCTTWEIPLSYDERLKEVGFGLWEGLSSEQICEMDGQALKRFYHNPIEHRPVDAESLDHFHLRVNEAYTQVVEEHVGKQILILAHAGVIRNILRETLNAPLESIYRLSIPTASLSRISITSNRPPTILFMGKMTL